MKAARLGKCRCGNGNDIMSMTACQPGVSMVMGQHHSQTFAIRMLGTAMRPGRCPTAGKWPHRPFGPPLADYAGTPPRPDFAPVIQGNAVETGSRILTDLANPANASRATESDT